MEGEVVSGGLAPGNARDSMSPKGFWSDFGTKDVMKYLAFVDEHCEEDEVPYQVVSATQLPQREQQRQAATEERSKNEQASLHDLAFPAPPTSTTRQTPPARDMAKQTCEPRSSLSRSRRPFELQLDDSKGASSLSTSDLRSLISNSKQGDPRTSILRVQVVHHDTPLSPITGKGRKKYPQPSLYGTTLAVHLPPPQQLQTDVMGAQHSHPSDAYDSSQASAGALYSSSDEAGSSVDSVLNYTRTRQHKPAGKLALLKKRSGRTSGNKFTAAVLDVPRAAATSNLDYIEDDEADEGTQVGKAPPPSRHGMSLPKPSPGLLAHPGSPDTITEESAARPMSAGTTVTSCSIETTAHVMPNDVESSPASYHVSALSPAIPTPPPLSEDSPHQYGLKDFADTPSPDPAADGNKAKRRSNGLDMFNDARSLQTAASFLNGLSNARRRAESRAGANSRQRNNNEFDVISPPTTSLIYGNCDNGTTHDPAFRSQTTLPLAHPPSPPMLGSPPLTPKLDNMSRTLGHAHKSSGFAYAKALTVTQLRCYRNHERLVRSGNLNNPVECAICHCDSAGDYFWSCSWCAVRMCGSCRNVFRQRGISALRDKIRSAELIAVAAA